MRTAFRNSKGKNTACITVNTKGRDIKLYYQLNDNPVQHIWQELQTSTDYKTYPLTKYSIDEVTDILQNICNELGLEMLRPLTQEHLNDLHREFVKGQGSTETWANLNTYIHIAETLLTDKFAPYNSIITFTHNVVPTMVDIEEKFKLWLTTESLWGDLLTGYETIGKDWLDLAKNNDDTTELKVKHKIGPETSLYFHAEYPFPKHIERLFAEWAETTGKAPLDSLNILSLGNYYLGHVIITDEFLNFHPVVSDWYVPNHKCKLDWNKEAIGADAKVVNIEFFDSDLAYETIIKHSDIEDRV